MAISNIRILSTPSFKIRRDEPSKVSLIYSKFSGDVISPLKTPSLDKFKSYFDLKIAPENELQNVEFDMEAAVSEFDNSIKDTQV